MTFQGNDTIDNLDIVLDDFDAHFTSLEQSTKEKEENDYTVEKLAKICAFVANDVKLIDENIKDITSFIDEGKELYITCVNYAEGIPLLNYQYYWRSVQIEFL